MFGQAKVVVISPVRTAEQAKILLSNVLKAREVIDEYILLVNNPDHYLTSALMSAKLEHPDLCKIESCKSVSQYLYSYCNNPHVLYVYVDSDILYITAKTIPHLLEEAVKDEFKLIHPMIIGSERTMYSHQVMGELPPILTYRWNARYMNRMLLQNASPMISEAIHRRFLKRLAEKTILQLDFGRYSLSEEEEPMWQMAAWKGGKRVQNHNSVSGFFKCGENEACILANSYATHLGVHPDHIKNETNIVREYTLVNQIEPTDYEFETIFHIEPCELPLSVLITDKNSGKFEPKIAISSHVSSYKKATSKLISGLLANKIPKKNIVVVVGGSQEESLETIDGILHSFVKHNSYDHTAMIDVIEKDWSCHWWIFLHDTCYVGPKFMNEVYKRGPSDEHISILKDGWLNMGLFSKEFIQRISPYVLRLKNCNKMQAILSEKMFPRLGKSSHYDTVEDIVTLPKEDVYKEGTPRHVMHLPKIDLYKYQSFHINSKVTEDLITSCLVNPDQVVRLCT